LIWLAGCGLVVFYGPVEIEIGNNRLGFVRLLLHCIHRRRVPSIGGTVFRSFAQRLLSHTQARPSSDVTARPRYR
jgi:hypothetical protein